MVDFRRISYCSRTAALMLVVWLTVAAQPVFGQPEETESLVLVVRDSAGQPLAGVGLELHLSGPPPEVYRRGLTDADGIARFLVYPADYLVSFVGDWREIPFIPPAHQNGGTQTSGEVGGFGVHLQSRPDGSDHVLTFVVVRNEAGQLVPLFDLSRDPALLPEPFLMDGLLDEETTITGDLPVDLSPLVPAADAQPTVVADIVQPLNPAEVEEEMPMTDESLPDRQEPLSLLFIGLAIFAMLVCLIGVTVLLARKEK